MSMDYLEGTQSKAAGETLARPSRTLISLYTRRRVLNFFNLGMSLLATAFGLFWLIWLLWTLLSAGLPALNWTVFTQSTPPPGSAIVMLLAAAVFILVKALSGGYAR